MTSAPDIGPYELSMTLSNTASGLLGILGGTVGLVGMQKKNPQYLNIYKSLKVVQILLITVASSIVLWYLSEIVPPLADELIEEIKERAREAHEPEPHIDRNQVMALVRFSLKFTSVSSIILWVVLGGYAVYIIHSLSIWYKNGVDPSQPRYTVSVPPYATNVEGRGRVQYATPLLQGQSPAIPVSIR